MFSQLGPLFKSTFRQAESNDTRQHIPHDERDKGRQKREDYKAQEEKEEPWNDNTIVTVVALRAFLIDFMKTIPEAKDMAIIKQNDTKDTINQRPHERVRPTNTHNAKAVRAYQTMAEHAAPIKTPPKENNEDNPSSKQPGAEKLQSKELRDLFALIKSLEILESRGIQELNIKKANSFLEGMKNAVEKALEI